MFLSIIALIIAIVAGLFSSLHYIEFLSIFLQKLHINFIVFRPLHTIFVSSWLFLGGITLILKYLLEKYYVFSYIETILFVLQLSCFFIAGIGILISVLFGVVSGREYIGYHPFFSLFIMCGWCIFTYLFFRRVALYFWSSPVYVYMWSVGLLYFIFAFIEGHLYLFSFVANQPIMDLQIQWKSYGSLVAAFNQIIQGGLIFVLEKLGQNKYIAHSKYAFALFSIGLLNSFTNFAHHTYHIPQLNIIKWISFVVSMLEIIILSKILIDGGRVVYLRKNQYLELLSVKFISLAKTWNLFFLPLAILISIPPLNSIIHGTTVVMAHAMGSEIAIDTYILLGVFLYLLNYLKCHYNTVLHNKFVYLLILYMNVCLIILVLWLVLYGTMFGVYRYYNIAMHSFMQNMHPFILIIFGTLFGILLLFFMFLLLFNLNIRDIGLSIKYLFKLL